MQTQDANAAESQLGNKMRNVGNADSPSSQVRVAASCWQALAPPALLVSSRRAPRPCASGANCRHVAEARVSRCRASERSGRDLSEHGLWQCETEDSPSSPCHFESARPVVPPRRSEARYRLPRAQPGSQFERTGHVLALEPWAC